LRRIWPDTCSTCLTWQAPTNHVRLPRRIGEISYARRERFDKSALVGILKKRRIDETQDKAFIKPRNVG
jgi:hypothetical protein